MSVIKTKKKIICDICGKDITHEIFKYSFREMMDKSIFKKHLCYECFKHFRKIVKEKARCRQ